MRTDARVALELLLRLGRGIDAVTLAAHGGITIRAARGMITRLARAGVLHDTQVGGFLPGPNAAAWLAAEPKTRPGGTSRRYMVDRQRRELARQLQPFKGNISTENDGSSGEIHESSAVSFPDRL